MRIVTEEFLEQAAKDFPQALTWVAGFIDFACASTWKSIAELRKQYPHADAATVASGKTVIILNVAGNKYRLITAIHFNTGIIYTLRFLTHAQYSNNHWKNEL